MIVGVKASIWEFEDRSDLHVLWSLCNKHSRTNEVAIHLCSSRAFSALKLYANPSSKPRRTPCSRETAWISCDIFFCKYLSPAVIWSTIDNTHIKTTFYDREDTFRLTIIMFPRVSYCSLLLIVGATKTIHHRNIANSKNSSSHAIDVLKTVIA